MLDYSSIYVLHNKLTMRFILLVNAISMNTLEIICLVKVPDGQGILGF